MDIPRGTVATSLGSARSVQSSGPPTGAQLAEEQLAYQHIMIQQQQQQLQSSGQIGVAYLRTIVIRLIPLQSPQPGTSGMIMSRPVVGPALFSQPPHPFIAPQMLQQASKQAPQGPQQAH
ncbi:hypothetical protein POM88_053732 [Heracleum sosnowskyi]|uniref:Uncharacterized protein n=1 Tax=Heracleum sosnowskyi TaxID=360622 RepID=A0AAD8GQ04_9APIA|nr:hypothetical protein POM88_053732 [Heracleum sosnowskyi]